MRLKMLVIAPIWAGLLGVSHGQHHENNGTPALEAEILVLSGRFPTLVPYHVSAEKHEFAFVYADTKGIVHHVTSDSSGLRESWRSFPIGNVEQLFVEDLNRDGRREIIALSRDSRVYVWDTSDYNIVWESTREAFGIVQAMAVADVDADDALELILAADNRLVYYDGVEFIREREGRDRINPSLIVVGDVDADGVDEIVTNDGFVFDPKTLTIEWADDRGFGYPMSLFDINNDGTLEVVGEVGRALRFWDVANRRELWRPVPEAGKR